MEANRSVAPYGASEKIEIRNEDGESAGIMRVIVAITVFAALCGVCAASASAGQTQQAPRLPPGIVVDAKMAWEEG